MQLQDLQDVCDQALIDTMQPGLKQALDALVKRGVSSSALLSFVRDLTGGPQAPKGGLTYLAVSAYLFRIYGFQAEDLDR